jgi:NADH dehydrogenase/NADH:ubiquinone oxidoreductase subunit G
VGDQYQSESESEEKCPTPTPLNGAFGDISEEWGISDRQRYAIDLMIKGHNDTSIVESVGVNRKTLWRWRNWNADFRAALADARMQKFGALADQYQSVVAKATAVLEGMLEDASPANRFRAAQTLVCMSGNFKPKVLREGAAEAMPREPEPDLPPKVG